MSNRVPGKCKTRGPHQCSASGTGTAQGGGTSCRATKDELKLGELVMHLVLGARYLENTLKATKRSLCDWDKAVCIRIQISGRVALKPYRLLSWLAGCIRMDCTYLLHWFWSGGCQGLFLMCRVISVSGSSLICQGYEVTPLLPCQGRITGASSYKAKLQLPRRKANQSINRHHLVGMGTHSHDQCRYPANTQLALPHSQRVQGSWAGFALRSHRILAVIYYRWRAERSS